MAVADFTNPKLTQDYTTLLQSIRDLNNSQALLHDSTGVVAVPTNTIRWYGANNRFEKFDGTVWNALTVNYNFGTVTANTAVVIGGALGENDKLSMQVGGNTQCTARWYQAGIAEWAFGMAPNNGAMALYYGQNLTTTRFSFNTDGSFVAAAGITATSANFSGTLAGVAANFSGDLRTWRAASNTTGVIFFGQSGINYLYYNGGEFQFNGGNLNLTGNGGLVAAEGRSNNFTNTCTFNTTQNTAYGGPSGTLWAYSTGGQAATISFHRAGIYAINMGLDTDNVFRIGGWSAAANRLQMDMSGNLTMAGNVTAYSDERLKTNWQPLAENFVDKLSKLKSGSFDRTDDDGLRQVGVSAQSLDTLMPEAVQKGGEYLSVAYGNAAMVSSVELAKEIVSLKEYNRNLEARLIALENK